MAKYLIRKINGLFLSNFECIRELIASEINFSSLYFSKYYFISFYLLKRLI